MIQLFKLLSLKERSHASHASRSPGTQRQECASIQSDANSCQPKRVARTENPRGALPGCSDLFIRAQVLKEEIAISHRTLDDSPVCRRSGPSLAKGSHVHRRRRDSSTAPSKTLFETFEVHKPQSYEGLVQKI